MFRQRLLPLLSSNDKLLCLILLLLSTIFSLSYDCALEGCSWTGPPVCGDDGLTYANECMAVCQDMRIASIGPCSNSAGSIATSAPFDDGTNVTITTMQRFQNEKFVLTGRQNIEELALPNPPMILESDTVNSEIDLDELLLWSRFTSDGYEYTAKVTKEDLDLILSSTGTATPSTNNRSLAIIGTDTRQAVMNNHNRFPYSPICELDYGFGLSEGGCTGTLIGKNSVLTAGHCLFNVNDQQWTSPLRMAPSRYRQGTSTIEPHGLFGFQYSTVFSAYRRTGDLRYDIGVATYNANSRGISPGDVAGTLCLAQATPKDLNAETILAGYPADFLDGTLVETTDCSWQLLPAIDRIVHDCDTATGQSGAPVITSSPFHLVGVHIGFLSPPSPNDPITNVAIAYNNATYSNVFMWAPDAKSCVIHNNDDDSNTGNDGDGNVDNDADDEEKTCPFSCSTSRRVWVKALCFVACRLVNLG